MRRLPAALALATALLVSTAAHAVTFPIGLDVTFAAAGNPFGAVVGTVPSAGTAETGSEVPVGAGFEFIPVNPLSDAGASLSLAIGGILFGHEDDIEASDGDVPALVLVDGALVGLDFVALVSISGTDAIGSPFDSSDLGQDTSGFLSSPHYWVDFDDEGNFLVGLVTGFSQFVDPEDGPSLEPEIELLVQGNVVPEPGLAILMATVLIGMVRKR